VPRSYCRDCTESRAPEPLPEPIPPPAIFTVAQLRSVLKNYLSMRSLYEAGGTDTFTLWGTEICVHDVLRGIENLPRRWRQAVVLVCLEDRTTAEAAVLMGLNSPAVVATYCRRGLVSLINSEWRK
jgi:hypothetical protein